MANKGEAVKEWIMDNAQSMTSSIEDSSMAKPDGFHTPAGESASAGATSTLPPPAPRSGLQLTAKPADFVEVGSMLFQEAESLLRSSRKQRLRIRLGRKTLAEMPLTTGAAGVFCLAMLAVALSRLTVELE